MIVTSFKFDTLDSELPAIQFENGTWYFSAQETCIFAELATDKNASQWVKNNIPAKWIQQIKLPGKEGRPRVYLTKPGFYFAVCQGKSEQALIFRDWVFEEVLVKIESQGLYVLQQNDESLADYESRVSALTTENDR